MVVEFVALYWFRVRFFSLSTKPKTVRPPSIDATHNLEPTLDSSPLPLIMPTNKKKNRGKKKKDAQSLDWNQLVELAETQDPEQAIVLLTQAISSAQAASSAEIHCIYEKRAQAKIAISDQEGALQDYRTALSLLKENSSSLDPSSLEQKAALFLYIGQLCEGQEALASFQEGISQLQEAVALREKEVTTSTDVQMKDSTDDAATLLQDARRQLSAAFCSAAELYLTDLCYEENAEHECESYISQALRLTGDDGEPFVDALQTVSSLRLSQKRGLEAVDYILRCYGKIRVGCEALASLVGLRESSNQEQASELLELDAVQGLPDFEFRMSTAKLLLECAMVIKEYEGSKDDPRVGQCTQAAVDVLGSLLAENDEVIEVWLLTGEAFLAFVPPNTVSAAHHYERAKQMLLSVKESLEQEIAEADDEEEEDMLQQQLDEVTCQFEDVTSKLEELQVAQDENAT